LYHKCQAEAIEKEIAEVFPHHTNLPPSHFLIFKFAKLALIKIGLSAATGEDAKEKYLKLAGRAI
jgi:hypothetical protein